MALDDLRSVLYAAAKLKLDFPAEDSMTLTTSDKKDLKLMYQETARTLEDEFKKEYGYTVKLYMTALTETEHRAIGNVSCNWISARSIICFLVFLDPGTFNVPENYVRDFVDFFSSQKIEGETSDSEKIKSFQMRRDINKTYIAFTIGDVVSLRWTEPKRKFEPAVNRLHYSTKIDQEVFDDDVIRCLNDKVRDRGSGLGSSPNGSGILDIEHLIGAMSFQPNSGLNLMANETTERKHTIK